jgi:hypothetical protein
VEVEGFAWLGFAWVGFAWVMVVVVLDNNQMVDFVLCGQSPFAGAGTFQVYFAS